jgi:hypothetical protein
MWFGKVSLLEKVMPIECSRVNFFPHFVQFPKQSRHPGEAILEEI